MLRLAVLSARGRLGTFTGALVALFAAAVLSMAWGMQLESILRTQSPVERYAGAAAVVTGQQEVGADHDVLLGERARVSSALAARLAAVPGVRAAIGDVSVPALLGGTDGCRPRLEQRRADAVRADRRTAARATRRGRRRIPGRARRAAAPGGHRARAHRHRGRRRPARPPGLPAGGGLPDRRRGSAAGGPSRPVDAIGVLAGPGFDASRLRAAAGGAQVLTGSARGAAEYPELERTRTVLIPVTAAFGGLAMFIAMFVVASTLGLSIQQREREIALMRAVAATPGQIRRMIAWEAAIVALVGSAAGIWPGIVLGRGLAQALVRHGIAPPNYALHSDWLPAAAAIGGAVVTALLAVLAAGRRAARVPPTLALSDAAVEPRLLGPGGSSAG